MDEHINNAMTQLKDMNVINEFLLTGVAPVKAQLDLMVKNSDLLLELEYALQEIKAALCN
jgi:flagellar basal body-associated protein FliL